MDCGAAQGPAVAQFIADRATDSSPQNPYHNSVILLYRWGANPKDPAGQSCSGVDSQYLLLNPYRETPIVIDGEPMALSDNQLSHEFGHFMGLDHPFPGVADTLAGIANLSDVDGHTRNPLCLPLIEANLPRMPGVTASELAQAKQIALDAIKAWVYAYDQDKFGRPDPPKIPDEYAITDTPIDLGV